MKYQEESPRSQARSTVVRAELQTRIRAILSQVEMPASSPNHPERRATALRAVVNFLRRKTYGGGFPTAITRPWARKLTADQGGELRAIARAVARAAGVAPATVWAPVKRALGVRRIDAIPRHRVTEARKRLIAQAAKTNVVRLKL